MKIQPLKKTAGEIPDRVKEAKSQAEGRQPVSVPVLKKTAVSTLILNYLPNRKDPLNVNHNPDPDGKIYIIRDKTENSEQVRIRQDHINPAILQIQDTAEKVVETIQPDSPETEMKTKIQSVAPETVMNIILTATEIHPDLPTETETGLTNVTEILMIIPQENQSISKENMTRIKKINIPEGEKQKEEMVIIVVLKTKINPHPILRNTIQDTAKKIQIHLKPEPVIENGITEIEIVAGPTEITAKIPIQTMIQNPVLLPLEAEGRKAEEEILTDIPTLEKKEEETTETMKEKNLTLKNQTTNFQKYRKVTMVAA